MVTNIAYSQIIQKLVIAATNSNSLTNLAYGTVLSKVADRKRGLIDKFEEHKVTKEIRAGAYAKSDFLDEGNLNSFIGFYPGDGEKQLDGISQLLNDSIRVRKQPVSRRYTTTRGYIDFAVELPTLKQIWAITPYPKGKENITRSGSWADDIESRGIGGLEYYIYLFTLDRQVISPSSRSGPAIQINPDNSKAAHRGRGEFGSISYIRDLMNEFVKDLK